MRKLMRKVAVFLFVIVMSSTSVLADDFNWVQWCEGNGIYSVAGLVAHGSLTTFEACEMIIIPSYEAGVIGKRDIDNFVELYPEAKAILEMNGVPVDTTPNADPTPAPTPATPAYTIEDCDMYKYATTDVNVRVEPDTNAGRVGSVE